MKNFEIVYLKKRINFPKKQFKSIIHFKFKDEDHGFYNFNKKIFLTIQKKRAKKKIDKMEKSKNIAFKKYLHSFPYFKTSSFVNPFILNENQGVDFEIQVFFFQLVGK